MDITFLVGNGFDMSLGIDTSYPGFFNWYIQQPTDEECIEQLQTCLEKDQKDGYRDWADLEMALARYTSNFSKDTAMDFITCYEDIHNKIIDYLRINATEFDESNVSDCILDSLRKGLADFYQELPPSERAIFTTLLRDNVASDSTINFISFNYTSFLDFFIQKISEETLKNWKYSGMDKHLTVNQNVIHAHGTWNEYPIVGVCDSEYIANKELFSIEGFQEIMLKPKSDEIIGEYWYNKANQIIDKSRIICIWGMSIGASDSYWWEKLVRWLESTPVNQLIVFWYTTKPLDTISLYKRLTEKNKIIERIASYSSWTREKINTMKNQIHVIFNTNSVLQIPPKSAEETEAVI